MQSDQKLKSAHFQYMKLLYKKLFVIVLTSFFIISPVEAATDVKNDPTLSTNLTSYWELEETSGTRSDSHGSNNLTDNNTVTSATAIQGIGADFERSNTEYLSITDGSQSGLEAQTDFSISFWWKAESEFPANGNYYWILTKSGGTNGTRGYALGFRRIDSEGGDTAAMLQSSTGFNATNLEDRIPVSMTVGTFEHWVYAIDYGGPTFEVYKNGVGQGTSTIQASTYDTSGPVYVGALLDGGSASNPADGIIDELGYWGKTLTAAEVRDLYNAGSGIPYEAPAAPSGPTPTPGFLLISWLLMPTTRNSINV